MTRPSAFAWTSLGEWVRAHPNGADTQAAMVTSAQGGTIMRSHTPSSTEVKPAVRNKWIRARGKNATPSKPGRNHTLKGGKKDTTVRATRGGGVLRHVKLRHYASLDTHGADVSGAELLTLIQEQRPWLLRFRQHLLQQSRRRRRC